MDSLTQIVLGAAVGEVCLGKKVGNKAMLWGAIAGTIPDLDVIGRSFMNDISAQEFHRGITHSLLFSIVMAPILAWLVTKIYHRKKEANHKQWTWLFFWSFVTHPLLDNHTTWGTQFFWPLDLRIAFNNINVVDPVYTIPFLILVAVAMFVRRENPLRQRLVWWGIGLSSFYMVYTVGIKFYTKSVFQQSLAEQHISYNRISNKPTMFNSILWTANVETDDYMYVGYYSLLDKDKNIRFNQYPKNHNLIESIEGEDQIRRLIKLTKNWYVVQKDKNDKLYIADMRFGEMTEGSGKFVFTSKLIQEPYEGGWVIERIEPEFAKTDMTEFFGMLMKRIGGDKDALIKVDNP